MIRWELCVALCLVAPAWAGEADSLARAIRENSFDREECYRVRDLSLTIEDIKIYLTDGHVIFSRPVGGKRIAAVFVADVEGGDAEVILCERPILRYACAGSRETRDRPVQVCVQVCGRGHACPAKAGEVARVTPTRSPPDIRAARTRNFSDQL